MISIDWTTLFTIVLFILFFGAMNKILYQPVLALMNERRKRLADEEYSIKHSRQEKQKIESDIRKTLNLAESEAKEHVSTAATEAEKEGREMIRDANGKFEETVREHRRKLSGEVETAREELKPEIDTIAKQIMKKILPVLILVCLASASPFTVSAAPPPDAAHGDTAAHDSEHHGISEKARVINFVILVSVLFVLLRKPVGNALSNRIAGIRSRLDESEKAVKIAAEEAIHAKEEQEKVFERVEGIRLSAEKRAERSRLKIREEAEKKIRKIESDTENVIRYEEDVAVRELRRFVLDNAFDHLETSFREGISPEADRRLVALMIDNFDPQGNGGRVS